ncbi:MAG: hypothetical protein IBGAMO2_160036 [Arenicellales bacterium IbO2]|nr:MAG: hypothetical protein IBGAMO2_160036 [Arenicellales bacterium IbO2]
MAMSKPVETPKEDLHTRMTRMETTLQFVATKEDLAALRGEMLRLHEATKADMAALRGEMRGDMSELRTELRGEMNARFAEQAVAREEAQSRMLKTLIGTACTLAATNAAVVAFLLRVM